MKTTEMLTVVIAATVLLTGCQPKPDNDAIAECWSQGAKEMVIKLSRESIVDKIGDAMKTAGQPLTAQQQANLTSRLEVTATSYYTTSVDRVSDSAHCGADISVKLTPAKGTPISAGPETQEFDIFPSETGRIYSLPQTLPLQRLVTSLDDQMTVQDQRSSPSSDGNATSN